MSAFQQLTSGYVAPLAREGTSTAYFASILSHDLYAMTWVARVLPGYCIMTTDLFVRTYRDAFAALKGCNCESWVERAFGASQASTDLLQIRQMALEGSQRVWLAWCLHPNVSKR